MKPANFQSIAERCPLITRNGLKVKLVHISNKKDIEYPVYALIEEEDEIHAFTLDGKYILGGESEYDIFIEEK
jgi:hypothetical protein